MGYVRTFLLWVCLLDISYTVLSGKPEKHVDVTKIWAEFDGRTGVQQNITASNTTYSSEDDTPKEKEKHVDVTKLWAEFDGKSGVKQNITAPPDAVAPNMAGTKEVAGAVLSAADADAKAATTTKPAPAKTPAATPAAPSPAEKPPSAAAAAAASPPPPTSNRDEKTASTPAAISGYQAHSKNAIKAFSNVGMVFLGDSTIAHINQNETFWSGLESKYHALNLAIPGEHTENLLYRLQNTDLSDIKDAQVVAILIGTLNIGAKDSPESVKNGISAIVDQAKKIFQKNTTIAVISILPRFSTRLNIAINSTNTLLGQAYANKGNNVQYIDMTTEFVEPGNPSGLHEQFYMPDLLHPSTLGYGEIINRLAKFVSGGSRRRLEATGDKNRRNLRSQNRGLTSDTSHAYSSSGIIDFTN